MNFKEYFEPTDIYLLEAPSITSRAAGRVRPALADPKSGKPYRKVDKIRQLKAIEKEELEKGTNQEDLWGSYSCVARFGIYYNAQDGGTPLGLYAFPLKYIFDKGIYSVDYGSSRQYLHIFRVKKHETVISMKQGNGEVIEDDISAITDSINRKLHRYIGNKSDLLMSWLEKNIESDEQYSYVNEYGEARQRTVARVIYDKTVNYVHQKLDDDEEETEITSQLDLRMRLLSSADVFNKIINSIIIKPSNLGRFAERFLEYSDHGAVQLFDQTDQPEDPQYSKEVYKVSENSKKLARKILEIIEKPTLKVNDVVKLKNPVKRNEDENWTHGVVRNVKEGGKYDLELLFIKSYGTVLLSGTTEEYAPEQFVFFEEKNEFNFSFSSLSLYSELRTNSVTINKDIFSLLAKDRISYDDIVDLSKFSHIVDSHQQLRMVFSYENINLIDYLVIHKSISTQENMKKMFRVLSKKIISVEKRLKQLKSKIMSSLKVPFEEELRKFCEENSINWSEILIETLKSMKRSGKTNVSGVFVYTVTRKISKALVQKQQSDQPYFSRKRVRTWAIWTNVLRKLGIDGMVDTEHLGAIHTAEPTQGVFFNPTNVELISTLVINDASGCDSNNSSTQRHANRISFDSETSHIGRWFIGLLNGFKRFRSRILSSVRGLNSTRDEKFNTNLIKNLNSFFVLFSSFVREYKKLDEEEIKNIQQTILIIKQNMVEIRNAFDFLKKQTPEEDKDISAKLQNAINLIDTVVEVERTRAIDLPNVKQNITQIKGFSALYKRMVRNLDKISNSFASIYSYNSDEGSIKAINILDSFVKLMMYFNEKDIKLKNNYSFDVPWRETEQFRTIKGKIESIKTHIRYGMDINPAYADSPQQKLRFEKIKNYRDQILKCVDLESPNGNFWCYVSYKKI